jgi:hypothetical protein
MTGAGQNVLALLRLDRLVDSAAQDLPLMADGIRLYAQRPAWARFEVPAAEGQRA